MLRFIHIVGQDARVDIVYEHVFTIKKLLDFVRLPWRRPIASDVCYRVGNDDS